MRDFFNDLIYWFYRKFLEKLSGIHENYAKRDQQDADKFLRRFMSHMRDECPLGLSNPIESNFDLKMNEIYRCPRARFSEISQL